MSMISFGAISTISNGYVYFGWLTSSYISRGFDDEEDVGDERIISRRQWDKYLYICSRSFATLNRRDLDTYFRIQPTDFTFLIFGRESFHSTIDWLLILENS